MGWGSLRAPGALLMMGVGVMAVGGCGGSPKAPLSATAYVDTIPLPRDTMTFRTTEPGRYGGRFVLAQTAAPKTFNAPMANETSSTDITQILFTGLAGYDNARQVDTPLLAKRWDISPDGTTWTFHLRRGARFSDGHPITSEDVLFGFQIVYDDKLHPSLQDLLMIDGQRFDVSAPDSFTVVVHSPRPYALMLPAVGAIRILPKHRLEAAYRNGSFESAYSVNTPPESLVTSGPWTLKRYVPGEKVVLTRNPYWFGVDRQGKRLPYLDELTFLIVPDQNTAALKFQAGEVDGLDDVKPEDYRSYADGQAAGHYTLYDLGPSLNTNFMFFNLNRVREATPGHRLGDPCLEPFKFAWFRDVRFRRAVSMAIDRDAIIRSVYFGDAVKVWATLTPGNRLWSDSTLTGADYDPAAARALLAGMGFRDRDGDGVIEDAQGHPVSFSIKTNGSNVVRIAMLNFMRDDLAKIGIRVIPAPVEFKSLIVNIRNDFQYDAALLGLGSAVPPDPGMGQNVYKSSGLTHYWSIKQPKPETEAEAEIDRLIQANVLTTDMAERHRTYNQISRIWNQQVFTIWLPSARVKIPVRNRFGNLEPSAVPHRILWNIDCVFAKPGARR